MTKGWETMNRQLRKAIELVVSQDYHLQRRLDACWDVNGLIRRKNLIVSITFSGHENEE